MISRFAGLGFRALLAGILILALSSCTQLGMGTSEPSRAVSRPDPDSRGVITYASYQVAVARESDTVASVAARVGIVADDLGRLNGLPSDYRLRQGEILVLPDSVARPSNAEGGISTAPLTGWTPQSAAAAIDAAPTRPATTEPNPFQNGQNEPLVDPIRHRVEAGETAYSIARLYGVSVTALASWNGLGPDLALRESQELLIPIVSGANQISSTPKTQPGQGTPMAPPASAANPLPPEAIAAEDPASPNLAQYRTPPGGRLQRPVNAPITKEYNLTPGPGRSEGVGFSVPAGTQVRAAGAGEVALVSESLGGLGTIVLIRHSDDLMTVYGRVDNVSVERGQRVTAGQPIGVVENREDPELHFEVRRGTDSVDPVPYIGS